MERGGGSGGPWVAIPKAHSHGSPTAWTREARLAWPMLRLRHERRKAVRLRVSGWAAQTDKDEPALLQIKVGPDLSSSQIRLSTRR